MNLTTVTAFVCPIRWQRSTAWSSMARLGMGAQRQSVCATDVSEAGRRTHFHQRSIIKTWLAAVRFMPTPPALTLSTGKRSAYRQPGRHDETRESRACSRRISGPLEGSLNSSTTLDFSLTDMLPSKRRKR
jgi:hypothetical protein